MTGETEDFTDMWALQFFVYAAIIAVLFLLVGGTFIGYYFDKKLEYERMKIKQFSDGLDKIKNKIEGKN